MQVQRNRSGKYSNLFVIAMGPFIGLSAACATVLVKAELADRASRPQASQRVIKTLSETDLARLQGYPSLGTYHQVRDLRKFSQSHSRFTESQLQMVQSVLEKDNSIVKADAIVPLAAATDLDQQRSIVKMVKGQVSDHAMVSTVFRLFRTYAKGSGRTVVSDLVQDADLNVSKLASRALEG